MPTTNSATKQATPTSRRASRNAAGWTLQIARQETRTALNTNVPASLKTDIDLLCTHFGQAQNEIVIQLLRHALDTNADLASIKAESPAPGTPTPAASPATPKTSVAPPTA